MKEKIKSEIISFIVIIAVILIMMIFTGSLDKRTQYLNSLDYDIALNEDGSMKVIETWDIYVKNTNTLFRNFNYSKFRDYGDIVDISVIDLDSQKTFTNTYEETYHVQKDGFYALPINFNTFEIAWGIGMDKDSGRKRYQIIYTITDVINEYKDGQELYWKFLEESNAIPAKNVTGTITLPYKVADKEMDLKAWGHSPLNGVIDIVSRNKVKFSLEYLRPNSMLEVRLIMKGHMINVSPSKELINYNIFDVATRQEEHWAEEADVEASKSERNLKIFFAIYGIVFVYNLVKLIQVYKRFKGEEYTPNKIQYFREIPRGKNATPGEAAYLYYLNKIKFNTASYQSNMIAATILNLCLKGKISLSVLDQKVFVKILSNGVPLKEDESIVLNFLKKAGKGKKEFAFSEFNLYIKQNYHAYAKMVNKFVNSARNSLYKMKLVDKAGQKFYMQAESAPIKYVLLKLLLNFMISIGILGGIPAIKALYIRTLGISFATNFKEIALLFIPIILIILAKLKILEEIEKRIAVFTPKGLEEKEAWKGLINYMKNFSMLNEKEVPDLILWEQYLVFATTFGCANRVIAQMKARYPEVFVKEYWEDEKVPNKNDAKFSELLIFNEYKSYTKSTIINDFKSNSTQAFTTSVREITARKDALGGGRLGGGGSSGGGFSSGGGRRFWWRPEWVEDKIL